MLSHALGPRGGEDAPFAHIEDSLAPAEHLLPADLEARLQRVKSREMTPGRLLTRAWIYNEYALATPGFEGDDALFDLGRADLEQVLASDLRPRHQIRFGANLLLHYEDIFRRRARLQHVPWQARNDLQRNLGELMLDFLGEDDLERREYGQLSELVAKTYLLNSDLLPYIASRREEANMVTTDNHDIYTLHPCHQNRVKKVPASIKFRQVISNDRVLGLPMGRMALAVVKSIPTYAADERFDSNLCHEHALRLAADIMVCKTIGDPLDENDSVFATRLTGKLVSRINSFAAQPTTPDYASNAEALQLEMATRRST